MPLFGAPHSSFLYCQADNRGIGRLVLVYCNLASKVNNFLRLLFPNQWQRFSYRIQRAGPKQSAKRTSQIVKSKRWIVTLREYNPYSVVVSSDTCNICVHFILYLV
jgi:hypothetical protein